MRPVDAIAFLTEDRASGDMTLSLAAVCPAGRETAAQTTGAATAKNATAAPPTRIA